MATYEFKTQEDIDDKSRTIVKTTNVSAITKEEEFTLESKEDRLVNLKKEKTNLVKQIGDLEIEISTIKTELNIE